jgi:glycosyltransferase involved in cell wall biosynthesis
MKVSVVIPTLNEEHYLPKLLLSLIDIGSKDLEVIVVDGHSQDQTKQVAQRFMKDYPELQLRFFETNNRNVSDQRNKGAAEAKHDVIIFVDADMILSKKTLEKVLDEFTAKNYSAATTRVSPIDNHPIAYLYYWIYFFFQKNLAKKNPYAMGAFLMTRKDVWTKLGGFDQTIKINEDANFVQRAREFGPILISSLANKISTRRFQKEGYLRMGIKYLKIWLHRTFRGEIRDDRFNYRFGHYDE